LIVLAPAVHASPDGPATVAEVVAAVKSTYKDTKSVRADFLQVRHDKALGTDDKQRGRISIERPRKVRIEMGFPMETAVVSDGTTLWVYNVKAKQVMETPEIASAGGMGVLLEDLGKLDELYNVSLAPETSPPKPSYTVQLSPKQGQGSAFKSLQLTLSKQKYMLQNLTIVDPLDNVTEMSFTGVRLNTDIPDSEFVFVPPPGVSVMKTGG
jgi:chaperone LolA